MLTPCPHCKLPVLFITDVCPNCQNDRTKEKRSVSPATNGARENQNRDLGKFQKRLGCLGMVALFLLMKVTQSVAAREVGSSSALGFVAMLFGAMVLVTLGCAALAWFGQIERKGKQHLAEIASELPSEGTSFLLYLRSFATDGDVDVERGGQSFEEKLCDFSSNAFPVYAIGRPGEELPELGAKRLYFRADQDEEWQQAVSNMMDRATAILFRSGPSEGLRWELDQARRHDRPLQTFVLFDKKDLSRYSRFSKNAALVFGVQFPELADFPEPPSRWFGVNNPSSDPLFVMRFSKKWVPEISVTTFTGAIRHILELAKDNSRA